MKNIILYENFSIKSKIYNGKKVITFNDMDRLHQRVDGTAKRNFKEHKEFLKKNEDYFSLKGKEIAEIQDSTNFVLSKNVRRIILLTKSGYLMLVKSFGDKLAWKVQRALVDKYFDVKEYPQAELISPAPRFDLTISFRSYRGRPCVSVTEMARVFNVSPITIRSIIRDGLERDTECQLLCGSEVREFYKENNIKTPGAMLYVIYPDGFKKIKAILEGREASYIIARRSAAQLKTKLLGTETSKNELATEVNRQFELQTQTVQESHKLIEASKPGLMDTILIKINGLDEKLERLLALKGGATQ